MDIQGQQGNDKGNNNRSSSLNGHRMSVKSRKSNQSCFSIGGHHYDCSINENQKMSLESNISSKAKDKFNQRDLFQNLALEDNCYEMRDEGSYRYSSLKRNTQSEKKVIIQGQDKISIQPEQIKIQEKTTCKCPKSKCLLMYCECFSKGVVCNEECSCYQCRNNASFQDKRQNARRIVLQRDPNAFMNKLEIIGGEQSELAYKRGCNCKKTNCFKKYCQCYFAGVKCTYLCKCQNCMNGGENVYKS